MIEKYTLEELQRLVEGAYDEVAELRIRLAALEATIERVGSLLGAGGADSR